MLVSVQLPWNTCQDWGDGSRASTGLCRRASRLQSMGKYCLTSKLGTSYAIYTVVSPTPFSRSDPLYGRVQGRCHVLYRMDKYERRICIVLSILEHAHNTSPCLHHSWPDLVRRQSEPISTRVAELIGIRVRSVALDIGVVCRRASGGVQGRAARPNGIHGSRDGADSGLRPRCECAVLCIVFGAETAVVAVGPENVLTV